MTQRTIVAIVNYNSARLVSECVASFPSTADLVFSVVDNGSSTANEADALERLAEHDPRIQIHLSPDNLGFGAAANLALHLAHPRPADKVWVLNPDTQLRPGCHEALRAALVADPGAILSPVIRYASSPEKVWFGGGEIDIVRGVTRHLTSVPADTGPIQNTFLTGAAMFMSAATWNTLGGFRDDLFMYWEDTDLCIRAQRASIRLLVIPGAEITHHVGASTSTDGTKSLLWYRYMTRNRILVCAPTFSRGLDLIVGRGSVDTARYFWRAIKEPGSTLPRFRALIGGTISGLSKLAGSRR